MDAAAVVVVLAGYLLGSVDFGVIVPRLRGVDIYGRGSGNPGATNVLRTMGRKTAAVVVLGDIAKGSLAAMLGDLVGGDALGFAAGFAAVTGHCFPIWHRFHGGKGVATSAGIAVWLAPWLGFALLVAWGLIVAVAKRASIASLTVAVALVPCLVVAGRRGWVLAWAGATAALIVARHHDNIRRLLGGSEHVVEAS